MDKIKVAIRARPLNKREVIIEFKIILEAFFILILNFYKVRYWFD